ncbi:MAG: prenyltransferase [Pseudomonadota bacterium]
MLNRFKRKLSPEQIKQIERDVASADEQEAAWQACGPLIDAQGRQRDAAACLVRIVDDAKLSLAHSSQVLHAVLASHPDDWALLGSMAYASQAARDIDDLNAAPPEDDIFVKLVERSHQLLDGVVDTDEEVRLLKGLATAARMVARQYDDIAKVSYQRLVELRPDNAEHHYGLGLFCKTRGRFREGMQANQTAARLMGTPTEATTWNLGICATGAGEGEVALEQWLSIDQKISMGRFDLPEGSYPQCKVRLAEFPLAERDASSDRPGLEETIWIERLSPCHGIVRSVLYQNLGLDYGDVILMDGAPITTHTYGENTVPVFPHLATLSRRRYHFYDFVGTQSESDQMWQLGEALSADAVIYSHTENYREICTTCYQDPDIDHDEHHADEVQVVQGRIAAPPELSAVDLIAEIDAAVRGAGPCRIYSPQLCDAAGLTERVEFEARRAAMLTT